MPNNDNREMYMRDQRQNDASGKIHDSLVTRRQGLKPQRREGP